MKHTAKLRIVFSLIWLILTFSMVSWWFLVALRFEGNLSVQDLARHERMIFWEGGVLLSAILVGGVFLIMYVYRDADRHEKLKFFFSNFSHDIKTSITRLKLQAELLAEDTNQLDIKVLNGLRNDLVRLDLQLENSLLLTHIDDAFLLNETISLSELVESLSLEFENLKLTCSHQAYLIADSRAIRSIFRNLLENSIRHGKATEVQFNVFAKTDQKIEIKILDNGQGTSLDIKKIGEQILPVKQNSSNGIGLFLAKKLIYKMNGHVEFTQIQSSGFQATLVLNGHLK